MGGLDLLWGIVEDVGRRAAEPEFHGTVLWLIGAVFALSGVAKLRQPELAAMAMTDFGVARHPTRRLGIALGAAESSLAGGLVVGAVLGGALAAGFAAAAAVVLWVFGLVIARSLYAGHRFECFCFGQGGSELSLRTALRTVALAVLATTVAVLVGSPGFNLTSVALQASAGIGALSILALTGRLPDLVKWNADPFGLKGEPFLR